MKKIIIVVIILALSFTFISIDRFLNKDNKTLQYTQLTSDQQNELSKEIDTIMGGGNVRLFQFKNTESADRHR